MPCPQAGHGLPSSPFAERLVWVLVALISALYFTGLTSGHIFAQDDFAAYLMHAANLVQGQRYTQIHYLPNPDAPWVSPANGYPPAYPLLLAPVYWQRGFDLRAMKMVTVFTFAIFLVAYARWVQPLLSPKERVVAVLLVGLSPAFWAYRDFISSEFPYLMISFLALLAIRRATSDQTDEQWRLAWSPLVAALMYVTYATRTVGIALPIAFACSQLEKHKHPSRFLLLTLALLAALIALQSLLITSPRGYVSVVHITAASVATNLWSYAKSITFAWQNGFSQPVQGILGAVLTGFAAFALIRRERRDISTEAWYLLVYLGILVAWGTQIGIRGLLPILPIYLTYVLKGISDWTMRMTRPRAQRFLGAVALCITLTYVGAFLHPSGQTSAANIHDPSAQELFAFLRTQTTPSDLIVFSKPRTLSLFTGRTATSLGPDETPAASVQFLQRAHARFLVQTSWNPPAYRELISEQSPSLSEVFRNRDFQVFRIFPEGDH